MTDLATKLAGFWSSHGERSAATLEDIEGAELTLGVRLPHDLRTLLLLRDGGVPNFDMFGEILVAPFRSLSEMVRLRRHAKTDASRGPADSGHVPDGVLVFANDAGAWFGLDYRQSKTQPSVIHWSEYETEPVTLTSSFRDFLEGLSST